ncbi:MAG TPA: N,N-dimethylformamidase beta subunit family domain-containing protein, partial [Polyangiales bacterium]|nr:N,N-dimethylformamidase beta subunit family domain-containing protein [Polyangiales bacterium]
MLPGSDALALTQLASDEIAGYTSAVSVAPGEAVRLHVNVDVEQDVRFELFRIGEYQGHGARLVSSSEPKRVAVQPPCPPDAQSGLVECQWAPAFDVTIGDDWVSGYYVFKLTNAAGFQSYVPLIVREGSERAPILIQASVNTWQAYNRWGGTSLYKNLGNGAFKGPRASRVSFDRPYEATASLFFKELPLVRWLERRGYAASYTTNIDVEADRRLLQGRKLFATVLHDEYWTIGERDALDEARDAGVSLLFLSANTGYWRVRLDASSSGVPRRIVTCYKSAQTDPNMNQRDTTDQFRRDPFARPENALIGVMWGDWSDFAGFPFVVSDPKHWIYEGTGVVRNDTLGPIIGIEWDGRVDNGLTPDGLEIVGDSPAVSQVGKPFPHVHASVYYPTAHSLVFGAGSINWITGLEQPNGDGRVARMLENLFARIGFPLEHPLRPSPGTDDDIGRPVQTRVLVGTGEAGDRDGDSTHARLSSPAGLAAAGDDELYIADTGNDLLRLLDRKGTLRTVAGCRQPMLATPGAVCLDKPIGVAVDSHGIVYVSDSGHNRIVRVSSNAEVSVYAGNGRAGAADSADPQLASFSNPRGLAIGPGDKLYVADFGNAAIRCIDAAGVTTVAHSLGEVAGVAVGHDGAIYIARSKQPRVARWRDGGIDSLTDTDLHPLEGIVVDGSGLLVADASAYRVRRVRLDDRATTTLLGDGRFGAGPNRVALPRGITPFQGGYAVADSGNH